MVAEIRNPVWRACILAALECAEACRQAQALCIAPGDAHRALLLADCADFAMLAARLVARASPREATARSSSAELALACAAECLAIAEGNEMLLACAAACQRCAQHWQELESLELLAAAHELARARSIAG